MLGSILGSPYFGKLPYRCGVLGSAKLQVVGCRKTSGRGLCADVHFRAL